MLQPLGDVDLHVAGPIGAPQLHALVARVDDPVAGSVQDLGRGQSAHEGQEDPESGQKLEGPHRGGTLRSDNILEGSM